MAESKKAPAKQGAKTLTCNKRSIFVDGVKYSFGDKVPESEVNKLPSRLHRWFS